MDIPENVQAICFDAVGTLLFPEPGAYRVYATVGNRHGSCRGPEEIRRRFAEVFAAEEALDETLNWRTSEEREYRRWQSIVARVLDDVTDPEACFAELYAHFARPDAWRCLPAAPAGLRRLADRGYRLALASNYDHRLRSVLAGWDELRLIHHVIISSEVGWRKPSPHFFAAVCDELRLPASKVFFIGDDPANDYQGATQFGMPAALVGGGGEERLDLEQFFQGL